jgi:hypothetical protein
MEKTSKPLNTSDISAFEFVKECMGGDVTYGINFDKIQTNSETGKYLILEYLLCDEKQFKNNVTPFTSHPNRYFHKNKAKFIKLWELTKKLDANLMLINYSKKNSTFENQVLLIEVIDIQNKINNPVSTKDKKMSREDFSLWLRKINKLGK